MESGEGYDRETLDLLGLQPQLLKALKETGTPLVVVYIEGRPLEKSGLLKMPMLFLLPIIPGRRVAMPLPRLFSASTILPDVYRSQYHAR